MAVDWTKVRNELDIFAGAAFALIALLYLLATIGLPLLGLL